MSRSYRVIWKPVAASKKVDASDSAELGVSLLGILPEAEMIELLREELLRRGWKRRSDGSLVTQVAGVQVHLEPDGRAVVASLDVSEEVSATARDAKIAEERVAAAATKVRDRLTADNTRRLSKAEPEVQAELGAAVQRVYVEALLRKAASLGEVESVDETQGDDGDYELVIKVKA